MINFAIPKLTHLYLASYFQLTKVSYSLLFFFIRLFMLRQFTVSLSSNGGCIGFPIDGGSLFTLTRAVIGSYIKEAFSWFVGCKKTEVGFIFSFLSYRWGMWVNNCLNIYLFQNAVILQSWRHSQPESSIWINLTDEW